MYHEMKKVQKKIGIRGWYLGWEGPQKYYLSKFDPKESRNEDEYVIHFCYVNGKPLITRHYRMKKSKHKEIISQENEFYTEALEVINVYHAIYGRYAQPQVS